MRYEKGIANLQSKSKRNGSRPLAAQNSLKIILLLDDMTLLLLTLLMLWRVRFYPDHYPSLEVGL